MSDIWSKYNVDDFLISEYTELLHIAKKNYKFVKYDEIGPPANFILWRHDCDYSINRAYILAKIEKQKSICSTFFLNPHCEFYNLFERNQSTLIEKILDLGHSIGLHFDASYYDVRSESQLEDLIALEASWLKTLFGVKISVFSFHNPTNHILTYEQETYGNLINCYSNFFKKNVAYCSDSNGYWRYRRLRDVLEQATDPCLQILTHPGWWQETAMFPRDKIIRCIEGRSAATIKAYDSLIEVHGRTNVRADSEQ